MSSGKASLSVILILIVSSTCLFAQEPNATVENNLSDLLHFLNIGRLDLAKASANSILESNPDPVILFNLCNSNPRCYDILKKAKDNQFDMDLAEVTGKVIAQIDKGRFVRRQDPKIIYDEIKRLSTTRRGELTAIKRLQDAGEYSIPYMIDALTDQERKSEWPNIIAALPKIGRDSIRPLAASLQIQNDSVKSEIVKAMGLIEYPQSLPYLKYVVENDKSEQLRQMARESINKIDPASDAVTAAQLFFNLAENYYNHSESLAPAADANFANIWFWDKENRRLERVAVDRAYFNDLMTMRCCEWSLKADPTFGQAIGLWIAAFFRAESTGIDMPAYFGTAHPDALVYATTAGPEYLHQALAIALKDKDSYIAIGVIEALIKNAGEKSLMYRLGVAQPLIQALSFDDTMVRYSAAIAVASAGPGQEFAESKLVIQNLADAIAQKFDANTQANGNWTQELVDSYALRAASAILNIAQTRNRMLDLSLAQPALVNATRDNRPQIQTLAGQTLAFIGSPVAQGSIAAMALEKDNSQDVRIAALDSLATSAKNNSCLLDNAVIDAIYSIISSQDSDPGLRSAAAAAYGALNLPSKKVKDLILDQSKS